MAADMNLSLRDQNIELIHQGIRLLKALPEGAYWSEPTAGVLAPPVGPHFRHCLDFYVCFLDGLDLKVVDYGARSRRAELEQDRRAAVGASESVAERLAELEPGVLSEPLQLRREPADDADREQWLGSTIGRELQFLSSHTIHHYALIALSLRLAGHPVPETFGVAPSTLEHWRREGRIAR
jgi:uncharacterized damage-inducible protein DinB